MLYVHLTLYDLYMGGRALQNRLNRSRSGLECEYRREPKAQCIRWAPVFPRRADGGRGPLHLIHMQLFGFVRHPRRTRRAVSLN